jgi:hypothetical protein
MAQRKEPPDSLEVISRADAIGRGQRWYFTGQPCSHGHIAKRSVSNQECRRCVDERAARQRVTNPGRLRAKDRRKYYRDVEATRALARASYARNIEKRREYDRLRYHNDPTRNARQRLQANEWWKLNRGKKNFMVQRRRAQVKRATPPWLTADHKKQIRGFYLEAASRTGEWHVDHIVPIRGETVCGLHVPWNLQILPGDDNRRKGNAFAS